MLTASNLDKFNQVAKKILTPVSNVFSQASNNMKGNTQAILNPGTRQDWFRPLTNPYTKATTNLTKKMASLPSTNLFRQAYDYNQQNKLTYEQASQQFLNAKKYNFVLPPQDSLASVFPVTFKNLSDSSLPGKVIASFFTTPPDYKGIRDKLANNQPLTKREQDIAMDANLMLVANVGTPLKQAGSTLQRAFMSNPNQAKNLRQSLYSIPEFTKQLDKIKNLTLDDLGADLISKARQQTLNFFTSKSKQPQAYYRGGGKLDFNNVTDRGISFTSDKKVAEVFKNSFTFDTSTQGVIEKRYLKPDAKILTRDKLPLELKHFEGEGKLPYPSDSHLDAVASYAKKMGFDAVDLSAFNKTTFFDELLERELRVLNPNVLITDNATSFSPDGAKQTASHAILGALEGKPRFNQLFAQFIGRRDSASTKATQYALKASQIPQKLAQQVIDFREGVLTKASPEIVSYSKQLKSITDDLYRQAISEGVPIQYLKNYIPHYWKESAEEVTKRFMSARPNLANAKQRFVPTYQEGISLGLTPKYTHPAEMIKAYAQGLEKLKANVAFLDELKREGMVVPASVGLKNPGFVPLHAPGIGLNETSYLDMQILGNWYAPEEIANTINKVFQAEDFGNVGKVTHVLGEFNRGLQDLTMSGGLPATPLNAFSFAQAIKEVTAGRFQSPMKAFFQIATPKRAQEFFTKNASDIIEMQEQNIRLTPDFEIKRVIPQSFTDSVFSSFHGSKAENLKSLWHQTVNNPTFKRFMPALQVNLYQDIKRQSLQAGKSADEAIKIASQAVKNFYGLIPTDTAVKRTQLTEDIASTFLFAPKYRESMVNFWVNTLKSVLPVTTNAGKLVLNNPLSLQNINNTRFAFGSLLTFFVMDHLNRKLNGHSMLENPPGKEDKLLIPLDDGYTLGIPFLSSIATIPRTALKASKRALTGDFKGVVDESRAFLSQTARPTFDLLANEDYFGNEILKEYDTGKEALLKSSKYVARQWMHPYLRELTAIRDNPEKPAYQRVSNALEAPLRFYKSDSLANAPFFDSYHKNKLLYMQYEDLRYQDPVKAYDFYVKNQPALDDYFKQKIQVKEFYLNKDQGVSNPTLTTQNNFKPSTNPEVRTAQKRLIGEKLSMGLTVNDEELKLAFLDDYLFAPTANVYDQMQKQSLAWTSASRIYSDDRLAPSQKQALLSILNIKESDIAYYQGANQSVNEKTSEVLTQIATVNPKYDELLIFLGNGRKEVNGSIYISSGVLDNLASEGIISRADATRLKSFKLDQENKLKPKTIKVKKPKKIKLPKLKAGKVYKPKTIKTKLFKPPKLKIAKRSIKKRKSGLAKIPTTAKEMAKYL